VSQLPASASFHEKVEALFSALRGRGLQLSGEDVELVDVWHRSQAPFDVVAKGIWSAFQNKQFDARPDERVALKVCRRAVEKEIKLYLRHSVPPEESASTVPFYVERFKALKRKSKQFSHWPSVATWIKSLKEPTDLASVERMDLTLRLLVIKNVPRQQRKLIRDEATKKSSGASNAETKAQLFRFYREMLTCEYLGIKSF
jgi:hypothetical protein